MRFYEGVRTADGAYEVYVQGESGTRLKLRMRLDIRNHSPSGFAWGYGGSGPAQLALALLADHFEHHFADLVRVRSHAGASGWPCLREVTPESSGDEVAAALHQRYKAMVVGGLLATGWRFSSEDITAWLATVRTAHHAG